MDEGVSKCKRCVNNSFVGTAAQQGVNNDSVTADISTTRLSGEIEVVPLNQFTRAGKRGHYEYFGVM